MWPLSLLYRFVIPIRRQYLNLLHKDIRYRCPVVVVGNLNIGGTGKTPLVMGLASELFQRGFNPGIVSRGYGGRSKRYPLSVTSDTSHEHCGDEPLLIARSTSCPVVVDPDRSEAVKYLLKNFNCDVVLSDDGLQHYGMPRDIEIVVIDGVRGFGNRCCLPTGPLREPETRLAEVDFVVTNVTQGDVFETSFKKLDKFSLAPKSFRNLSTGETKKIGELSNIKKVHAVAAIGAPERFEATLTSLGFEVVLHAFEDHRVLGPKELSFEDDLEIIVTSKDAIKLQPMKNRKIWVLDVVTEIKTDLVDRLEAKLISANQNLELHSSES